jgi:hypothetical protein
MPERVSQAPGEREDVMARHSPRGIVGRRVTVRHGFLWLRTGQGTVRATYSKEGRDFATVELDGNGKLLPRLVSQLRLADPDGT